MIIKIKILVVILHLHFILHTFYPFLDDKDFIPCFRSTGVVKIPKKTLRKSSLPVFITQQNENLKTQRKKSCPSFTLKNASEDEIICKNELAEDFCSSQIITPKYEVEPKTEVMKKARCNKKCV